MTTKITDTSLLSAVFPENRWKEFDADLYGRVFQRLRQCGSTSATTADYLEQRKIKLGFHEQYKSGAGWTLRGNITLSPGDDPLQPYVLCLILHEAFHLQQSILMRLSVQGELRAWQLQKRIYPELTGGNEIGAEGQAYGGTKAHWDELDRLSPDSREDLKTAQVVMKRIAPDYRSNCLPLYPLLKEIGYFLGQGQLAEAFGMVWNLVTCK